MIQIAAIGRVLGRWARTAGFAGELGALGRTKRTYVNEPTRAVSLWDVLTLFAGASAFGGAYGAAVVARADGSRLVLCVVIGLGLAMASTWLIRRTGERVAQPFESDADDLRLRLLYGVAVVWIFAAAVLAHGLVTVLLRFNG